MTTCQRARDEYAAHPIAACIGRRRAEGHDEPCEGMALTGQLCVRCIRERNKAALRARANRAAKAGAS